MRRESHTARSQAYFVVLGHRINPTGGRNVVGVGDAAVYQTLEGSFAIQTEPLTCFSNLSAGQHTDTQLVELRLRPLQILWRR